MQQLEQLHPQAVGLVLWTPSTFDVSQPLHRNMCSGCIYLS